MRRFAFRIDPHKALPRALKFTDRLIYFNQIMFELPIQQAQVTLLNLIILYLGVQFPQCTTIQRQ